MEQGPSQTGDRPAATVDELLARVGRLAAPARPVVGLATIGLEAYWPQFPGLRERLQAVVRTVAGQLAVVAEVVDVGMVDTAQAGRAAGEQLAGARKDLTVIHVGTYATSSLIQRAGAAALILNLQPTRALSGCGQGSRCSASSSRPASTPGCPAKERRNGSALSSHARSRALPARQARRVSGSIATSPRSKRWGVRHSVRRARARSAPLIRERRRTCPGSRRPRA